ncbi:MAG: Holliday junction branch migration protein RuvA [Polyangiaceae bacterium]|nr:Holliday junction branch migration protein RuvA [Polyangiaceae bacterium]
MIGRLRGEIVDKEPNGRVTVDVGGVGYDVLLPLGTLGRVTPDSNGRVTLSIHTNVREDALDLYGFANETDRQVFRLLVTVQNVGPKVAMAVMSELPSAELFAAVEAKDIPRLNKVPGVGKKTAERLALDLAGKLPRIDPSPTGVAVAADSGDEGRLISALTNMGYRTTEAERAVEALGPRVGREPLPDLLKAALAELSN